MSYYDKKTRRCWITRPASTYIVRLMGFARAAALRLGRKPFQEPERCRRHWSSSLGKANMTTRDGIVGGALGQPYLSDMARRFRNCSPGGGGGQSKRPAGMWLPRRTAPGVMSTYPDLPWWKGNLDNGNSSKGLPVQPDPYGQCHSRQGAAWMDGDWMVRTPTKEATWKPWVPSTYRMGTWGRPVPSDPGETLPRRQRDRT